MWNNYTSENTGCEHMVHDGLGVCKESIKQALLRDFKEFYRIGTLVAN